MKVVEVYTSLFGLNLFISYITFYTCMQSGRDLTEIEKLSEKAGLPLPEQRILVQFLRMKLDGIQEALTADNIAKEETLRIHKEKVYTYLKRLSELNLIESVGSERPRKYRAKGSVQDVIDRLDSIALEKINAQIKKIESLKNDLNLLTQQVKKKLSVSVPEIEMDFYGVNMGAEIHERASFFLERLKPGEELLAITPSALILSVPEHELMEQPLVKNFRDLLVKRLLEKEIYATYICYLDWFLTKPPEHRFIRLQTLLENIKKLPNLELIDASSHRNYISASPTLTIYGSEAVMVGLKGRSRRLEKGVVFTGKDVVNFFRDLFFTTYNFLKRENLELLEVNEGDVEHQDESTRLKSYITSKILKLLKTS